MDASAATAGGTLQRSTGLGANRTFLTVIASLVVCLTISIYLCRESVVGNHVTNHRHLRLLRSIFNPDRTNVQPAPQEQKTRVKDPGTLVHNPDESRTKPHSRLKTKRHGHGRDHVSHSATVHRHDAPRQRACQSHTLLVIIFNGNQFISNVQYLRQLYSPAFCSIAFYGPTRNDTYNVTQNVDQTGGWLQQQTVVQASRQYPNFDGYLWAGDDVFFNPWKLLSPAHASRRAKVWVRKSDTGLRGEDVNNLPLSWHWPQPFMGPHPGYTNLSSYLRERLPERFRRRQLRRFGGERLQSNGADFGYIPKRFMSELATLTRIEGIKNIKMEIFVPTFSHLLSDNADDVVELNGVYLWSIPERQHWLRHFNCTSTDFVHPVKFSDVTNRDIAKLIMSVPCC
eukprot:scpid59798/ scgid13657/ 